MFEERGVTIVITAMLLCLLLHSNIAHATIYTVGDNGGWGFSVGGWPNGKSFKAGDTLVFKYSSALHNVVVVDKGGYDSCKPSSNAKVYQTGNDQIKLGKGVSYFICSFPGHCQAGMKIAVTAT